MLRFSLIENGTFDELFNNFWENNGKDTELYVRKKHQLSDYNKNWVLSSNEKLEGEIIMWFRSIFAEFENTIIIEITRKLLERLLEHIMWKEASHWEIDILSWHKIDWLDWYTYQYNTWKEESHIIDLFIKDSDTKKRIKDQIRFYAQLNEYLNPDGTYKYNWICNIPQILKWTPKENP